VAVLAIVQLMEREEIRHYLDIYVRDLLGSPKEPSVDVLSGVLWISVDLHILPAQAALNFHALLYTPELYVSFFTMCIAVFFLLLLHDAFIWPSVMFYMHDGL